MIETTQAGEWVPDGYGAARWYAPNDRAARVYEEARGRWAWWIRPPWTDASRGEASWVVVASGLNGSGLRDTREEAMAAADAWLRERGYLPAEPAPAPAPPPPPPPEIHPDPAVAGTVRRELLDAIRDCVLPAAGIGPVTSREPDYARGALLYLAYRALKDDDREHVGAMALLLADVDKLVAGGWDYERAGKVLAAIHLVYGGLL